MRGFGRHGHHGKGLHPHHGDDKKPGHGIFGKFKPEMKKGHCIPRILCVKKGMPIPKGMCPITRGMLKIPFMFMMGKNQQNPNIIPQQIQPNQ